MEDTEILVIKKSRLEKILNKFHHIKAEMDRIANNRYESGISAINIAHRAGFKVSEERLKLLDVKTLADFYNKSNASSETPSMNESEDSNQSADNISNQTNSPEVFIESRTPSLSKDLQNISLDAENPNENLNIFSGKVNKDQVATTIPQNASKKEPKSPKFGNIRHKKSLSLPTINVLGPKELEEESSFKEELESVLDIERGVEKKTYDFENVVHKNPYLSYPTHGTPTEEELSDKKAKYQKEKDAEVNIRNSRKQPSEGQGRPMLQPNTKLLTSYISAQKEILNNSMPNLRDSTEKSNSGILDRKWFRVKKRRPSKVQVDRVVPGERSKFEDLVKIQESSMKKLLHMNKAILDKLAKFETKNRAKAKGLHKGSTYLKW